MITHQSDLKVGKKFYNLKPNCISKWYSINVDYKAPDLIPIPLGVANFHSKNLNKDSFSNIEKNNYFMKEKELMYINFNPNTNFLTEKIFTLLLKLMIGQQKISYHWKMMNIKKI